MESMDRSGGMDLKQYKIAFIGHPNVGKSTWINILADAHMHVGNYAGITVDCMSAMCKRKDCSLILYDLPGLYSLQETRNEERKSATLIQTYDFDVLVHVWDGGNSMKHQSLYLELQKLKQPVMVLLNHVDENDEYVSTFVQKNPQLVFVGKRKDPFFREHFLNALEQVCKTKEKASIQFCTLPMTQKRKKELHETRLIDHFLLDPVIGKFILLLVLGVMFVFIFRCSIPLVDVTTFFIQDVLASYVLPFVSTYWQVFLQQVIFQGVGSVIGFAPLIGCFYFCLAFLEESGYMARIAYLMDPFMRRFSLSGKAFVVFLFGYGCNVPALYATRSLSSYQERKVCATCIPFLSCSARLPVYLLFLAYFFPKNAVLVLCFLYAIGLFTVFVLSTIFSRKEEPDELMEVPILRLPSIVHLVKKAWIEMKQYVCKAILVVTFAMLLLWSMLYLPTGKKEESYLKQVAEIVQPFFLPLGFGESWELIASLPVGIGAKESVIGFFEQYEPSALPRSQMSLFEIKEGIAHTLRKEKPSQPAFLQFFDENAAIKAFSYLVFYSLTIPCILTLQAIRSMFGNRKMWKSIALGIIVPYCASWIVYHFSLLFLSFH